MSSPLFYLLLESIGYEDIKDQTLSNQEIPTLKKQNTMPGCCREFIKISFLFWLFFSRSVDYLFKKTNNL